MIYIFHKNTLSLHPKQINMQFPTDFVSSIRSLLCEETEVFFTSLAEETPVSIRLNSLKNRRNPLSFSSKNEKVKWSDVGYYLPNRPPFTFDPLFHAGYYYVQEAASMFVEQVVKQLIDEPVYVLDLCAAPGGKSVTLLSALPEGSLLVSNEIIRQRANVLAETMTKFGHPNSIVTNNAPKNFVDFPHFFDVVLVDAPCSGEGMFRKDEVAVQEWSLANVQMCAVRQREILRDIWDTLKPGGLLIYSTCTYNLLENEENARWISRELGAEFVSVKVEKEWGISSAFDDETVCYRFFPHKTKGEGLFVSVLRKNDNARHCDAESSLAFPQSSQKVRRLRVKPAMTNCENLRLFLKNPGSFDFIEENNRIIALPKEHSETFFSLRERLKIIAAGIEIGERKGKDFIPSHSLAMSMEFHFDAFPQYEVSYEQAIAYLRKEVILLNDAPIGFVLLTFKNEPIGFVKNLGSRANNLYPQEWRIRSGYLPLNPRHLCSFYV
jgi:16S rRNA C967 or C1407 C5-methylase (RsmB/RsmF family)/NOL1/NOP2/fmu family ribosome biogenesis protein